LTVNAILVIISLCNTIQHTSHSEPMEQSIGSVCFNSVWNSHSDDNAGSMVDAARPLIVALEHSWTLCEASWRRQCRFHGRAVDDAQMSKNVEAGI